MGKESFLLSVVKKIESLKDGIISYGYLTGNIDMTYTWWQISVSDYDLYMHDERFKRLARAWHKIAESKGFKLIFVCDWIPKEEKLVKLAEEGNLILNV